MRTAFINALVDAAAADPRVWLLTGDLGYSVLEAFATRFPDRYVNVGVAEQNMTGVAAGLAMAGKVVFTYSIANFPVVRCLEQIRNDVCYHNLPVRIVAVGGGMAYGSAGYSHFAIEDLALTRVLPNMTVLAPGDPIETDLAVHALVRAPGPAYLRLGKAGEPVLHDAAPDFEIGRALCLRDGRDVTLVSTGGMLGATLEAAGRLSESRVYARVLSMATVRPLDVGALIAASEETGAIVTIEEHSSGGLAAAVAEALLEGGAAPAFRAVRIREPLPCHAGSHAALRQACGLSSSDICEAAMKACRR